MKYVFIIILGLAAGCTNSNNRDSVGNIGKSLKDSQFSSVKVKQITRPDSSIEDFYIFLDGFSNDSEFQVSRVIFPFIDCDVADGDSTCSKIIRSRWSFLKLVENHEIAAVQENNCTNSRSEFKIYSIIHPEGPAWLYYFKNISGKWYLHHRVNYDD